jgi:hypothetical protein
MVPSDPGSTRRIAGAPAALPAPGLLTALRAPDAVVALPPASLNAADGVEAPFQAARRPPAKIPRSLPTSVPPRVGILRRHRRL